ncbi:hypothetical protein HK100_012674 [Physocladia obscura]|uniref:Mitotic checkpoint protein BUB3 n=1 Tax=Physocladia obscura TaxID=109957 RepID=A0AAD5TE31_9FUNG|nr:hypothetical protein HK100_012674 [Physocladia obscura]
MAAIGGNLGNELFDPPSDTISGLSFSRFEDTSLLVSSWDKTVRLYDAHENSLRYSYTHDAAVLDVSFATKTIAVSGGLDKHVKSVDLHTTHQEILGSHDEAVKCIVTDPETNLVISGSWDKTVKLFDLRQSEHLISTHSHPQKIHSMDAVQGKLVVATADRLYYIYDLRNLENPLVEERLGHLKFMTRSVACMPNGDGYATASIEGRVSVEFFDNSEESQSRRYAFKCHREKQENNEKVYPVNALAFHPIYGTFVSGGSDGVVSLWDGLKKKRVKQYVGFPTGISALGFNRNGTLLAIGCSYTFEEGEKDDKPADSVYIRPMTENEAKPKAAVA